MDIKSLQTLKRALTKSIQDQFHHLMADIAKKQFPPGTEVLYKADHLPGQTLKGKVNGYMASEPHLAMIQRDGGTGDTVAVWLLEPVKPMFIETAKIERAFDEMVSPLSTDQMVNFFALLQKTI